MRNKYKGVGLDYDLIIDRFPNLDEYEQIVNTYLADEFFKDLKVMLEDEDYAMAKDAVKGLYILAQELRLFPLYAALLEIYEDIEYEIYKDAPGHYEQMMEVYERIRSVFHV